MILTQTPLRIPIGGGGTDLPSYYSKFGGFFISAAINRYLCVAIQRTFSGEIVLKYSEIERVKSVDEIKHSIIKAALKRYGVADSFEMASFADIPAGTGLGSSGSFTVGLVRGLYALKNQYVPTERLAEEASDLLMNTLNRPDGKQDQYATAYGGINCYTVSTDGRVTVEPLKISDLTLGKLRDNLLMFFTGFYRQADEILNVQKERTETGDEKMIEGLHFIKDLGSKIKKALEDGRADEFGGLMREHWEHKKKRAEKMTNTLIDQWYELALQNGALGGKIVGAGGGGFLLFYTADREKLIKAMTAAGLRLVKFDFDFEGSKLLLSD
jgi:D-glycero-alpha-D-manno-heptose-7-phosphate kinase